jgi:hypothetical protein
MVFKIGRNKFKLAFKEPPISFQKSKEKPEVFLIKQLHNSRLQHGLSMHRFCFRGLSIK